MKEQHPERDADDTSGDRYESSHQQWAVFNATRWKRSFIPAFLGPDAAVEFIDGLGFDDIRDASRWARVLLWASDIDNELAQRLQHNRVTVWRAEDGFIRSVGLGAEGARPYSLVLDSQGMYYDAGSPCDLETLLREAEFPADTIQRAAALRERLVALGLSKYNFGRALAGPDLGQVGRPVLLVPGQVESDASIARGAPRISTNLQLLREVRRRNPDAFLVYKPHPDVLVGARQGALPRAAAQQGLYDLQVVDTPIVELLRQVDEVHTMTSLAGFEALLRGIRVVTYGLPFYAGWGLTEDRLEAPRRGRQRTLDELVAATLILYPRYADPASGRQLSPEQVVDLLAARLDLPLGKRLGGILYTRYRRLKRSVLRIFGIGPD